MRICVPVILIAIALSSPAQEQPIPDLPTLTQQIRANQQKTEQLRENYTFHHTQKIDDLDAKGKVQSTTSEETEVFFVNRHRIARLVKKDGKELTEAEKKDEDRKVTKRVEEAMKGGNKSSSGNFPGLSQMLAVAKISSPRRLTYRGRETLVFDFAGDPAAHGKDMNQNMAKKMSGTIWIDDAERQVARMEVKFDENFKVGGGLFASIQAGTNMEMEQSPLGEGLWMQTSTDIHLGARLIVKNFRKDIHNRNSDFRKFDVGTLQQIKPPSR